MQKLNTSTQVPPSFDLDWKHNIQTITAELGIPTEAIWMLAALFAFFYARRVVAAEFKIIRTGVKEIKSLVQIIKPLDQRINIEYAWAKLLLQSGKNAEVLNTSRQLLSIGAKLARLQQYESTVSSTFFGVCIPLIAIFVWFFGVQVKFGLYFNIVCIAVAWLPVLALCWYWYHSGELERMRISLEANLDVIASRAMKR